MNIRQMSVNTFWKGEVEVKALVEDQGREYQVLLYGRNHLVRDRSCSCKEGKAGKAMCRHADAVWEAYQKKDASAKKNNLQAMIYTSPEVRTMVREYTNREVAQIQVEGQEAAVSFFPKLTINSQNKEVRAEFRVGREKSYLIKDLLSFSQAMRHGTYLEYGKNFAFYHSLDAFTPESRPLVEFVVELANTYQDYYMQFCRSSFETRSPLRELNLSRENRDRFFALTENQVLESEIKGQNGTNGKKGLLICRQNPQFHIQIQEQGTDGLSVSINGKRLFFFGEKYLYLVDEEKIYRCDKGCSQVMRVFLEQMAQSIQNSISINKKDIPLFYERVLQKIEPYCLFEGDEIEWENYRPEPLQAEFSFDIEQDGKLTMVPTLFYGSYSFHPIEDEKLPRTVCRDIPGEFRVNQLISKYFQFQQLSGKKLIIQNDDKTLFELLEKGIGEFSQLGSVRLSEAVKKCKILPPVKIKAAVSMAEGWLNIKVDMEGLNSQDFAQILKAYQQKQGFYRLKTGEFLELNDDGLSTVACLSSSLSLAKEELLGKGVRLPRYRALYLDSLLKEGTGIVFSRDQQFKALVRGMKSVEDSDFAVPDSLQNILRGYQTLGFRWLRTLDAYGFGGILADDMGLGKTVQIITLFADEYSRKSKPKMLPSLIICPASLVYNWENEFQKFAPNLRVCTIAGTWAEREPMINSLKKMEYQIFITSYDLLKRDREHYQNLSFRFQVIDEAQYIKNASTKSSKAVKAVKAETRFALTGTPIENRLSELWSIFDYLMPGFLFFTYPTFRKHFEIPIIREGDQNELQNLRRLIGPFILRRLKKDVLKELPDKLETYVYSRFEGTQKTLYMAFAAKLKEELEEKNNSGYCQDKLEILTKLTKLRQICCDPRLCDKTYSGGSAKLETCMDLILHGIQGGHKILLFSQFTSMLEIIEKRLREEEISFFTLTGETPKKDRLRMVDSFQSENIPVFLISLKAGGTGLNLTAADMVIHYDPWWNVAAENQASDRAHRIGQEKQVSIFKLITKGTIEENIKNLQEAKKNLADQIVAEGGVSLSALSREDILEILREEL